MENFKQSSQHSLEHCPWHEYLDLTPIDGNWIFLEFWTPQNIYCFRTPLEWEELHILTLYVKKLSWQFWNDSVKPSISFNRTCTCHSTSLLLKCKLIFSMRQSQTKIIIWWILSLCSMLGIWFILIPTFQFCHFFHFWERCVSIEISWLHPAFITGIEGIFGSFLETWDRNHCIELLSKSEVPCTGLSVPEQLLTTYQLIAQKSLIYNSTLYFNI